MKKFMFSALACVAFAGSAFASNEIVLEKQDLRQEKTTELNANESEGRPCNVYVWAIGPDGKKSWQTGEGGSLGWDDCGKYKDKFLQELKDKKFNFSEEDVTVIWG